MELLITRGADLVVIRAVRWKCIWMMKKDSIEWNRYRYEMLRCVELERQNAYVIIRIDLLVGRVSS